MTVIDAHIHLWRLSRGDNISLNPTMTPIWRDLEPPDLRPRLDAAGVDKIVVVQAAETFAEALYLLGLALKYPWIAAVVPWIEPASPAIEEEVAALAANPPVRGVRPIRDDNRSIAWMLDARLKRGWEVLKANGLLLEILVQNWREVPLATEIARQNPKLTIILDHCAKPDIAGGQFEPWANDIAEFARLPNVSCKLSHLLNCAAPGAAADAVRPYALHVLKCFGAERVMWASDWPPLELAASYARWKEVSDAILSELPDADRSEVMGGTAERIYRLGLAPD